MSRSGGLTGGEGLVFLCSMPRSGSTVFSMMLGAHSAILSPPEPWILLPLADLLGVGHLGTVPYGEESAALASAKYLDRIVASGAGAWLGERAGEAARARSAGAAPETVLRDLVTAIYAQDLRLSRKRLFVDKTPRYYRILPLLDRAFPRARKIFLVRNPLDVASSYKATWGVSVAELSGRVATANSYDFCHGLFELERHFVTRDATKLIVSYEALVRQPKIELTRICRFLGLRFEPAMLRFHTNALLTREHREAVVGDPRANLNPGPVDADSVGRWRSTLSVEEKQQLVSALGGDIFKLLGYAPVLAALKADGIRLPAVKAATEYRKGVVRKLASGRTGKPRDRMSFFARMANGLLAERSSQSETIQHLAEDASVLKREQDGKAQEIERLTADRASMLAVNERLAAETSALAQDRAAKTQVIHRLSAEIESFQADRAALLATNERLASETSGLEKDRDAKSQVIDRLSSEIVVLQQARGDISATAARLSAELERLTVDRMAVLANNQRLATDMSALGQDRDAKSRAIERMLAELAGMREEQRAARVAGERLAADKAVLEQDRSERSETIAHLATKLAGLRRDHKAALEKTERLAAEAAIRSKKLAAKSEVLRTSAARELERKALLGGAPDLLWYRQRYRKHHSFGRLIAGSRDKGELHVAVDTLEIIFGVSGGVETYMKMLVAALLVAGHRVTLICMSGQLAALQAQFADQVAYFVVHTSRAMELSVAAARKLGKPVRLTAEQTLATFARLAEDLGIHLLHSPIQIFSALDFRVPAVLNLHDLQHLHFPENFRPSDIEARNYLYGLSASLADAVVVSSGFVRQDLIERMGLAPQKVFTVPVTWDPRVELGLAQFSAAHAREHYRLPSNYALYPAQFWAHKNHVRLVEALKVVRDRTPASDLKLVLTGYRGHTGWPKVAETIQRLGLESEVLCLDHVPVEHLAGLYKGAAFCVVPSIFEASSYPVIEAQVLGVPAMCSAVTSLPELMRDGAGLLFNPLDVEDIAAKMLRWVEDPADRAEHAERAGVKVRNDHGIERYVAGINGAYQYALQNGG